MVEVFVFDEVSGVQMKSWAEKACQLFCVFKVQIDSCN
jgi:hypothetical protein